MLLKILSIDLFTKLFQYTVSSLELKKLRKCDKMVANTVQDNNCLEQMIFLVYSFL